MIERSKPSTAKCNANIYMLFLIAEPKYVSCVRLAHILGTLCHDSINRFLLREQFTAKDLFEEVKTKIHLKGRTLSIDDSVLDKPDREGATFIRYIRSPQHSVAL